MPAVESSTTASLSLPQSIKFVLSQTKIPLAPVLCAASHDVGPDARMAVTTVSLTPAYFRNI
jgi:hypothetical protein